MTARYVASCLFTARFPQVCARILSYLAEKHPEIEQVRCCIPRWKPQENIDRINVQMVRAT